MANKGTMGKTKFKHFHASACGHTARRLSGPRVAMFVERFRRLRSATGPRYGADFRCTYSALVKVLLEGGYWGLILMGLN